MKSNLFQNKRIALATFIVTFFVVLTLFIVGSPALANVTDNMFNNNQEQLIDNNLLNENEIQENYFTKDVDYGDPFYLQFMLNSSSKANTDKLSFPDMSMKLKSDRKYTDTCSDLIIPDCVDIYSGKCCNVQLKTFDHLKIWDVLFQQWRYCKGEYVHITRLEQTDWKHMNIYVKVDAHVNNCAYVLKCDYVLEVEFDDDVCVDNDLLNKQLDINVKNYKDYVINFKKIEDKDKFVYTFYNNNPVCGCYIHGENVIKNNTKVFNDKSLGSNTPQSFCVYNDKSNNSKTIEISYGEDASDDSKLKILVQPEEDCNIKNITINGNNNTSGRFEEGCSELIFCVGFEPKNPSDNKFVNLQLNCSPTMCGDFIYNNERFNEYNQESFLRPSSYSIMDKDFSNTKIIELKYKDDKPVSVVSVLVTPENKCDIKNITINGSKAKSGEISDDENLNINVVFDFEDSISINLKNQNSDYGHFVYENQRYDTIKIDNVPRPNRYEICQGENSNTEKFVKLIYNRECIDIYAKAEKNANLKKLNASYSKDDSTILNITCDFDPYLILDLHNDAGCYFKINGVEYDNKQAMIEPHPSNYKVNYKCDEKDNEDLSIEFIYNDDKKLIVEVFIEDQMFYFTNVLINNKNEFEGQIEKDTKEIKIEINCCPSTQLLIENDSKSLEYGYLMVNGQKYNKVKYSRDFKWVESYCCEPLDLKQKNKSAKIDLFFKDGSVLNIEIIAAQDAYINEFYIDGSSESLKNLFISFSCEPIKSSAFNLNNGSLNENNNLGFTENRETSWNVFKDEKMEII